MVIRSQPIKKTLLKSFMINYKGNNFKIIAEKIFADYKDVIAVGVEGVKINFRIWDDGMVEFKKR